MRVTIEPFDMKFLGDYCRGFDEEAAKYQWPDPFESEDDAREMIQGFLDEMEADETLFYSVLDGEGSFVGGVEMHGLSERCPELGVWIVKSQQRKGYAYEALKALLDKAKAEYGKTEFFYEADIRNEGSNGLLKKLEGDYEITPLEVEEMVTDSGKELKLKGNILKAK